MQQSILAIALVAALTGCKNDKGKAGRDPAAPVDSAAAPAAPSAPASTESGGCDINVEGSIAKKDHAPGGMPAIGTDYWMSDGDMRQALVALETNEAKVEERLKGDPRLMTLAINCIGPSVHISFSPSNGSKYADIVFGPRKYQLGLDTPGSFLVIGSVDLKSFQGKSGTLDVTRFDDTGIAATFELEATMTSGGQPIKVSGAIDMPCPPGYGKCKR